MTEREIYLNNFQSSYTTWASAADNADVVEPPATTVALGFAVEQPKHSVVNWWMKRVDSRLDDLDARISWLETRVS